MRSCARFLIVLLAVFVWIPAMRTSAALDPVAKWFNAGRCAAFNGPYGREAPVAKPKGDEHLEWRNSLPPALAMSRPVPSYAYDVKHGIAFRSIGQDSSGSLTLRLSGIPPARVPVADLSGLHTTSGAKLGMSSDALVRLLGKPLVIRGCGTERYAYTIDPVVGGNALEFTIRNGRVVEIFQTYGD